MGVLPIGMKQDPGKSEPELPAPQPPEPEIPASTPDMPELPQPEAPRPEVQTQAYKQ